MYTRTSTTTPIESDDKASELPPKFLQPGQAAATAHIPAAAEQSSTKATWEATIGFAPPGELRNHPAWSGPLGFASTELEEQLIASVRENKVVQPLIVTGTDCASGEGVILDGSRRRQAALDARVPLVPVIRRTGLTAEAEEEILLKAALASAHTRKLKQSNLAMLENRLYELRSRGRGFRTDLTSVGTNGGGEDALTAIARDSDQSRNSVANRRKVFFSRVAPKVLRDAVDTGAMSLTAAAAFIREAEGRDAMRSALELSEGDSESSEVQHVKADVEAEIRKLLKRPKRAKRAQPADATPVINSLTIELAKDGMPSSIKLAGKTYSMRVGKEAQSSVTLEIVRIPDRGGRHGRPKRAASEPRHSPDAPGPTIVERDAGGRVHLAVAGQDPYGRKNEHPFIEKEIARGAFRPFTVLPAVSGLPRPMTILLAKRRTKLLKFAYHGDVDTFCPPFWGDLAIGSGACGFGCRTCFLILTWREMRDPLRPVVYDNGSDYERIVAKWLHAKTWWVDGKGLRERTGRETLGLGIDCADSLLWEGVTGHARGLIPRFLDAKANPLGNQLVLLTKSANVHYLEEISELRRFNGAIPNVAVTMSLNPEPIADLWEGKYPDTLERITPPIARRLEALRYAQDMGFEVRVRVDPVLTPDGWEDHYADFFRDMVTIGLKPTMLTLGTHREKNAQLDTFRARWELPAPEWQADMTQSREGTHFHMVERGRVYQRVRELAHEAFGGTGSRPWVSLCKETHDVRREAGFCNSQCNCLKLTKVGETQRTLPVV